MEEEIRIIQENATKEVITKKDLFLSLCALNLLNKLVKKKEYKSIVGYDFVKPAVFKLIKGLFSNGKESLCEELLYEINGDCIYIRCYGLQFSFHHVSGNAIREQYPDIVRQNVKWDGIKLQQIAEELYNLAVKSLQMGYSDNEVLIYVQNIKENNISCQNI